MLQSDERAITQYLTQYQNPEKSKRDITTALQHFRGLSCKREPYVFNDGSRLDLVNLQGTIPVEYRGKTYNIPICIWLMDTHPNNAPMCYVKPTADMHIKVSAYVDHTGKIYLPYLHTWSPNSSDLLALIQVMVVTFGEQPPVYSKLRTGGPSVITSTPYPAQPYMPVPGVSSSSSSNLPYPPYPPGSSYTPPTSSYPGYPPYPSQFPPYSTQSSSMSSVYPPYGAYPPYPGSSQVSPPPPGSNGSAAGPTGTITEDHIRASLLSAVEDKMRRRLREQFSQMQAELETLGRTQQELTQGKTKLDEILSRLEREQAQLDKNITMLEDKEQELDKAISRLAEQEPIDVDEAVTTTAPLYKQLLNAFAEEAATEDTIYYMGEALRRGVIDLDVFQKQVRSLSRKQFMLRALMQKCRQKAGLVG